MSLRVEFLGTYGAIASARWVRHNLGAGKTALMDELARELGLCNGDS